MENNKALNAFIASAGFCSRRKAVDHIKAGDVFVNGEVITDPGYRVQPNDQVTMQGRLVRQKNYFVYILLNKPRDCITTCADERGRKTVLDVIGDVRATVYPVGRLDRNTTGLLLLTNDGQLAQALSHPKHGVAKEYYVTTDLPLEEKDIIKVREGIMLDDGFVKVDLCVRMDTHTAHVVLHSGRYRVVRRLFEHFGYDIVRLDRIKYAGLTKKGLTVGDWRYLEEHEVLQLKKIKV